MSYNPQNPNGQATSANSQPVVLASDQSAISASINDGTTKANNVAGDTGQSSQLVAGSRKEVTFSTTTAQAVASTDVSNYRWVSLHITSQGTNSTINFQGSNDNANWLNIQLLNANSSAGSSGSSTGSSGAIFYGAVPTRYFRLSVTGITAGTTAGVVEFFSVPGNYSTMAVNSAQVAGTAFATNTGTSSGGTQRVVIATDQPSFTNAMPVSLAPSTSGGWSVSSQTNLTTTATVSAAAGKFGGYMFINLNATPAYLQVFDTTGAVTLGTTAPTFVIPLPANSTPANGAGANLELTNGLAIASGIKVAATTTATGATTVTTGLTGFVLYK